MLKRNLLYTGVTRGKRLVVLVGQKKAVAIAVRNASGRRRWAKPGVDRLRHGWSLYGNQAIAIRGRSLFTQSACSHQNAAWTPTWGLDASPTGYLIAYEARRSWRRVELPLVTGSRLEGQDFEFIRLRCNYTTPWLMEDLNVT